MRRLVVAVTGGIFGLSVIFWWTSSGGNRFAALSATVGLRPATAKTDPLPFVAAPAAAAPDRPSFGRALHDPVIVAPCHVVPIQEQEVSSAVDGIVKDVFVDLGQRVQSDQLLGRLDDRQLRAQTELLQIKARSNAAELIAKAQYDDLDLKVAMNDKLRQQDAISAMDYKSYFFQRQRFAQEMQKAREDQATAQKELEKGQLLLHLHDIRSGLNGEVVKIHKRNGEAVKQSEPLFRVANFDRLRIEGLCKLQQADLICVGMRVLVEPELRGEQMTELTGHTGAVTSIAIAADGRLLASASEDRTILLWNWPAGTRRDMHVHPAEVHAVALSAVTTSAGKRGYWLLTGCADGQARRWFVPEQGSPGGSMPVVLGQEAAVRAVAFSADGSRCATGGDDRRIGIWETATGQHLMWLQAADDLPAHNGAVTSLQFTKDGYLVSAGRDNTVKIWKLSQGHGELAGTVPGRTGETTQLGVSPDGRHLLFDHGEELRILDRTSFEGVGFLRSPRRECFRGLAQFSPTGNLILAAAGNGRLQLWKVPAPPETIAFFRQAYSKGLHAGLLALLLPSPAGCLPACASLHPGTPGLWSLDAFEVRQFQSPGPAVILAAAFAPDESVLFTGGSDKVIRVWTVPEPRQWQRQLEARITYVAGQVESGTDMVRVRADVDNPHDPAWRLRPGTHATLRLYPETASLP